MKEETAYLKVKYSKDIRHNSVIKIKLLKKNLSINLHEFFVFCPLDKATKNVSVICKQFNLNNILEECKTNNGIADVTDKSVEVINDSIYNFNKEIGIKTDSVVESLPIIFSIPKFDKPSIKPLAIKVSLGL